MGFVGGDCNIDIATALPPIIACVLYCQHQIVYGFCLSHFLWLPDASVSGYGDKLWPAASCTRCLQNVWGLAGNLIDLTVASSQYDILLCSETLVSDMRHV